MGQNIINIDKVKISKIRNISKINGNGNTAQDAVNTAITIANYAISKLDDFEFQQITGLVKSK